MINYFNKRSLALAFSLTVLAVLVARADAPVVSGFIDTTYNYNFNRPLNQTNALRSFDSKANNFALNAAQMQLTGTLGDTTYVVKFLAGTDALVISPIGAGPSTVSGGADYFDVEEAYLSYKCPITGLNLKAGKFVTLEGIEVIESKDNPTISRGYLFGLAEPYTHTGAMLSHVFGKFEIGAGVVNGWDIVNDNNRGKTLLGKVAFNMGDPLSLVISGTHGPEQANSYNIAFPTATVTNEGNNRDSLDATAVLKIIPKVTLNLQANVGTERRVAINPANGMLVRDNWSGAGIQPVLAISNKLSLGARLEYFYDKFGSRVASSLPSTVAAVDHFATTNFSIAPAYKMTDTTTVRLEYRYDKANKKAFIDDKGELKKNDSTVSVEWIQTF